MFVSGFPTDPKFWFGRVFAECSQANNRDLWASESQLAFIYFYIYILYIIISVRHAFTASGGKPRVQNGDSDGYTDAVFELLPRKRQRSGQVYCIVLSSKAYYSSQGSRVCVAAP